MCQQLWPEIKIKEEKKNRKWSHTTDRPQTQHPKHMWIYWRADFNEICRDTDFHRTQFYLFILFYFFSLCDVGPKHKDLYSYSVCHITFAKAKNMASRLSCQRAWGWTADDDDTTRRRRRLPMMFNVFRAQPISKIGENDLFLVWLAFEGLETSHNTIIDAI